MQARASVFCGRKRVAHAHELESGPTQEQLPGGGCLHVQHRVQQADECVRKLQLVPSHGALQVRQERGIKREGEQRVEHVLLVLLPGEQAHAPKRGRKLDTGLLLAVRHAFLHRVPQLVQPAVADKLECCHPKPREQGVHRVHYKQTLAPLALVCREKHIGQLAQSRGGKHRPEPQQHAQHMRVVRKRILDALQVVGGQSNLAYIIIGLQIVGRVLAIIGVVHDSGDGGLP